MDLYGDNFDWSDLDLDVFDGNVVEVDGFELTDASEDDAFEDDGDFALDDASGLFLPADLGFGQGAGTIQVARRLNPAMLAALDADDADAFFRRLRRIASRAASGFRSVAGGVGRGLARVARTAAPLLRRALPMIQRVAGIAGPWGRLVSAGIGAVRGIADGRGLRGALAGAVSGAIPGIGGQIASSVLRGDGADDDAGLDALADMAQVGRVSAAVAMPLGAALGARAAMRQGVALTGGAASPRAQGAWGRARTVEPQMLQALAAMSGPIAQRLRLLQLASRHAAVTAASQGTPSAAAGALPKAARLALARVQQLQHARPQVGAIPNTLAAQRLAARRRAIVRVGRAMQQANQFL